MQPILDSNEFNVSDGKFIAVKFWATWCGPCKQMHPSMLKLEEEFPDIKFISVEIEQAPEIVQRFKVKSLPSVILLKDGEEVKRINGMTLIEPMRKVFRELLAA